jgi:hypothetical protein
MSFGYPPSAFQPDAYSDYVLKLNSVPEPASWAMMLAGFGLLWYSAASPAVHSVRPSGDRINHGISCETRGARLGAH